MYGVLYPLNEIGVLWVVQIDAEREYEVQLLSKVVVTLSFSIAAAFCFVQSYILHLFIIDLHIKCEINRSSVIKHQMFINIRSKDFLYLSIFLSKYMPTNYIQSFFKLII